MQSFHLLNQYANTDTVYINSNTSKWKDTGDILVPYQDYIPVMSVSIQCERKTDRGAVADAEECTLCDIRLTCKLQNGFVSRDIFISGVLSITLIVFIFSPLLCLCLIINMNQHLFSLGSQTCLPAPVCTDFFHFLILVLLR